MNSRFFRNAAIAFIAFCGVVISQAAIAGFDAGFTDKVVKSGDAKLATCRAIGDAADQMDCVSKALSQTALQLDARKRAYGEPARTLRKASKEVKAAAKEVRRAKSDAAVAVAKKAAIAALETAEKEILRSSGVPKEHAVKIATVATSAKAILRS